MPSQGMVIDKCILKNFGIIIRLTAALLKANLIINQKEWKDQISNPILEFTGIISHVIRFEPNYKMLWPAKFYEERLIMTLSITLLFLKISDSLSPNTVFADYILTMF